MSSEVFGFQGQKWVPRRGCGELTLSLGHSKNPNTALSVHIDVSLVPSWVLEEEGEDGMGKADEHRHLHLSVSGIMPAIGRWQDLAGVVLEDRDEVMAGDEVIIPEMNGPEVSLFSGGPGGGPVHRHVPDGPISRLVFGKFRRNESGRDEIKYEIEAFFRSERGREEMNKQIHNEVAEMFGEAPPNEINEKRLAEGWTLRHKGWAAFDKVFCMVPVNAADPVGYAKAMALRELGMTEFSWCYVNGADHYNGTFKPEDGICVNARLVALNTPSDFYYEWKAQRERQGK
ncbi:MAG: hypothetical protein ABL962_04400 [Fimbriimonadaceae bacterium]